MATAADILFWTKFTVTDEAAARFSAAAEERLNRDGGSSVAGELRTQLVCYLAGDMIATSTQDGTSSTEHIGDYSYTTSTTSSATENFWLEKYRTLLSACFGYTALPTSENGGIIERTVDKQVVRMSRTFTDPEFF